MPGLLRLMGPPTTISVLVALLVGLAVGKAWERYKLQDGAGSTGGARASRRTTCSA